MAFVHSGQASGYNSTDLTLLAKFPMVQFDKKQGLALNPTATQEDRFIIAARKVLHWVDSLHRPE
jgi:hypothetical protein